MPTLTDHSPVHKNAVTVHQFIPWGTATAFVRYAYAA